MSSFARLFTSILLASALGPRVASSQVASLAPGETALVVWREPTLVGSSPVYRQRELVVVRADALQLVGRSRDRMYIIERVAVTRVRRRIGTRPATAPEIVAGSAIGFGAAFVLGAASSSGDRADMGLSTGVLVGAPIGALVAWLASRSRGIYEDVPMPDVRVGRRAGSGRIDLLGRVAAP
jgi:hypothetical protein